MAARNIQQGGPGNGPRVCDSVRLRAVQLSGAVRSRGGGERRLGAMYMTMAQKSTSARLDDQKQ